MRASVGDLSDGVACSEVLHQIAPEVFGADKLEKITRETKENTRIKAANLRRLVRSLLDFYEDVLRVPSSRLRVPQDKLVAEGDPADTVKLLELLLGVAVQCQTKETHVQNLMTMEEAVKADLMGSIQNLLAITRAANSAADDELSPAEQRQLRREKEELAHIVDKARRDLDAALERCEELETEAATLRKESAAGGGRKTDAEEQQTAHRLRTELDEFRHTLEHERAEHAEVDRRNEKMIVDLKRSVERAEGDINKTNKLRDELEELREVASKVKQLETQVEIYQSRMEKMAMASQEGKAIEEANADLLKRIMVLEESERKAAQLQNKADKYQEQLNALEERLLTETKKADRLEFSLKKAKEDLVEAEDEAKRLLAEKKDLAAQVMVLQQNMGSDTAGDSLASAMSPDAHEKLVRLEHENTMLRAQAGGATDEEFQAMLDDASRRKAQLERLNREQELRILELESLLEKAKKGKSVKSTDDMAYEQLASAERSLTHAQARVVELEEELAGTQHELISIKKEHSLMGLDQKQLMIEIEKKTKEQVGQDMTRLETEACTLRQKVTTQEAELEQARKACSDYEIKVAKLADMRDEKTESLNKVLLEKDELRSKVLELTEQSSKRIQEQERRYAEATAEMTARLQSQLSGDSGSSKEEMLQLQLKLTNMEKDQLQQVSKMERDILEKSNRIKELDAEVVRLKEQQEKHKEMIQRARMALKKSSDATVIETLKNQLAEKTREYEFERQNREKLKAQYEREERLLVSAWYEMGVQYQRLAAKDERQAGGSSFLARQRQAALTRHANE